ncbi:MAG: MerR family transcriptional regulator [SAR202 cluster bacterium]|nr:MerR family transcriptional regulator [SAR202 cluster bacterium]|tara:strand:- start:5311 stop:5688 length:378 start_codon:yes stop_codon:yes gene_type:complete
MTYENQDQEPAFVISVAARMVGLHAQTLRSYERLGLVTPERSRGNRRFYSREDIEQLRHVKSLLDAGVNLAGVEMVMKATERIAKLQEQIQSLEDEVYRLRRGRQQFLLSQPAGDEKRGMKKNDA